MGNIIMIAILMIIIVFALRGSYLHLKGESGCCQGGSGPKPMKKKLHGPIIAKKVIVIEGMHCNSCKKRVEDQLNQIDGALVKVNLKKKIAVVSMERMIPDMLLTQEIEKLGFQVIGIELKEA
ncbi:MAG: heavy-metal-associated domain-containing protein [Lachnospiraceae bacterium]|nr:heavy-metal-associated domain-containing protein [Lachnospiraceae bacterium]